MATYLLQRLTTAVVLDDRVIKEWRIADIKEAASRRQAVAIWYPKNPMPGHMRVRKQEVVV